MGGPPCDRNASFSWSLLSSAIVTGIAEDEMARYVMRHSNRQRRMLEGYYLSMDISWVDLWRQRGRPGDRKYS
jgi:hypothetical protein